jgi:hypothetical protein
LAVRWRATTAETALPSGLTMNKAGMHWKKNQADIENGF